MGLDVGAVSIMCLERPQGAAGEFIKHLAANASCVGDGNAFGFYLRDEMKEEAEEFLARMDAAPARVEARTQSQRKLRGRWMPTFGLCFIHPRWLEFMLSLLSKPDKCLSLLLYEAVRHASNALEWIPQRSFGGHPKRWPASLTSRAQIRRAATGEPGVKKGLLVALPPRREPLAWQPTSTTTANGCWTAETS